MIEGEAIELIDPLALGAMPAAPRLCLLHGAEAGWMEIFLKPAIEAAGYRVVRQLAPGEMAEVALAMDGEEEAGVETGRLLRLGRTPADPLYRYDRAAVVAALEEAA